MRNIQKAGNVAILPESMTIFEKKTMTDINPRDAANERIAGRNIYVEQPMYRDWFYAGTDMIVPDGPDNLFPYHWKRLIENDSIMPGMLRQRIDLLLAGNTGIFVQVKDEATKKIINDPVIDNAITDWMQSWDFDDYLVEIATDFIYVERASTTVIPNNYGKLPGFADLAKIAKLRRDPIEDVRMGYRQDNMVTDFFVSDWRDLRTDAVKMPAYNKELPFANPSIFYTKMPSFCSKHYGRPSTIGVANYLNLKLLILNNTEDMIINAPFRYHIESPLEYWRTIKEINHWDDKQLESFENQLLSEMDAFLKANDGRNAMKRFHSKYAISEQGRERLDWRITPIEDDSSKRIEGNFKAFENINEAIIASSSLDPALSNIQITGKLSSGLDKLIAFNVHQLVNTPQPRRKILAAVNEAIRLNFWKGDYRPFVAFNEIQLSTTTKDGGKDANNNN